MTYEESKQYLIFEAIAGSHAYGTAIETSDTDTRGVYLLPNETLLGITGYKEQTNDSTNDTTYYELNRFARLLLNQAPNVMEMLWTPEDKILICEPAFEPFIRNRDKFITKKLKDTFGGYAISQIKKARGMNKKIVNPLPKERRNPLHFCNIVPPYSRNSYPLLEYLEEHFIKWDSKTLGFSKLHNMPNCYAVYNHREEKYRGLLDTDSGEFPSDVRVSEIDFGHTPLGIVHYNEDGFKAYCKEYREYWEWVEKRNPDRYETNMQHGKQYDSKNVAHCFRLLNMALEIPEQKTINVHRSDREFLLSVRRGELEYDDAINRLEGLKDKMDAAFEASDLPDVIDEEFLNFLILKVRTDF